VVRTTLPLCLALLISCRPAPPPPSPISPDLVRVDPSSAARLADDGPVADLIGAISNDLEYFARRPEREIVRLADAACSVTELRKSLEALREAAAPPETAGGRHQNLEDYVRDHFLFYRSTGRKRGPLFTGYYEPIVDGRRSAQGRFVHPLYRRPADLLQIDLGDFLPDASGVTIYGRVAGGKLEPYYSRREIDAERALAGRGLEIVWLDDPVARFFLHVQGSGIVRLADGSTTRVGFAASNGKRYTSIGRLLAADGSLAGEAASTPAIQRYLHAHPERRDEVLFQNERYVFFGEVRDGPVGKLGVKLTAGRSVAVDLSLYPPGALAYVETEVPLVDAAGQPAGRRRLRRLLLAQDTGGAITGPGRLDLFFGSGERAGLEAGYMSARGEVYFLMPRECGGNRSPSP
jgi:peptidoglycan lytic transglycosylase A